MNHPAVPSSKAAGGKRQAETSENPTTDRRRLTTAQIEHGQLSLGKYEATLQFCQAQPTATWKQIRAETGVTAVQFCRWSKTLKKAGLQWGEGVRPPRSELIAALAKKSPPGRKPKFAFSESEAARVAAHNLQSNRTMTAGSPQHERQASAHAQPGIRQWKP
jgi:hypothetical protein